MVASWTEHEDQQLAIFISLEHVVWMNQQAAELLRNGEEVMAASFLKDAVAMLAMISRHEIEEPAFQPDIGHDRTADVLPFGLTISSLPPIDVSVQGQAPSLVVSIIDNGTFALHHGSDVAQSMLVTLTLYHMALAIHRGCCRVNCLHRAELTRCRDLYQLCNASFAFAPEMDIVKYILDANVGQLHSMFDYPAAA
jgi:hypothetical protein